MRKRMLAVLLASVTACSLGGCAGKKKDTVRTVKIFTISMILSSQSS